MTAFPDFDVSGLAFAEDGRSIIVTDERRRSSLARPKSLSFSAAKSFEECPGRWVGSQSFRFDEDDPFKTNHLGTAVHGAIERIGLIPGDERVLERAKRELRGFIEEHIATEDRSPYRRLYEDDVELARFLRITDSHLDEAFKMKDWPALRVIGTEHRTGRVAIGGNGQARLSGSIDLVTGLPNGTVVLGDIKTGKKSSPFRGQRDEKGDQLRLYAAAWNFSEAAEEHGRVDHGEILYTDPKFASVVPYSTGEHEVDEAIAWFVSAYDGIVGAHAQGEFALQPSALCAWCPLANVCPQATIGSESKRAKEAQMLAGVQFSQKTIDEVNASLKKARDAAALQPTKVDLPIPTLPRERKVPVAPRILQFDTPSLATQETLAMTDVHTPMALLPNPVPVAQVPAQAPQMPAAPAAPFGTPAPAQAPVQQAPAAPKVYATPVGPKAGAPIQAPARQESKPYEPEMVALADGTRVLSLNSYAAMSLYGAVSLAYETVAKLGLEGRISGHVVAFANAIHSIRVRAAQRIGADATAAPEGTMPMAAVSMNQGVITRVTGLLRTILEVEPHAIPFGQPAEAWQAWADRNVEIIIYLSNSAEALLHNSPDLTPEQLAALAAIPASPSAAQPF